MKKNNEHDLYAISPSIDYKDFYLSYHKRKKPILLTKESEFPKIKNTSTKTTDFSIQNTKNDFTILKKNSLLNITDNNLDSTKTNSLLNYLINSPFTKTEQICYPKINPIFMQVKNFKQMLKAKVPKKLGRLSVKYIDLINIDKRNNILIYEIKKNEKSFENELINNINDSSMKDKILYELRNIDNNTTQQIENIMNITTKQEKDYSLKEFNIQPKIINLCAEEIFKELQKKNNSKLSSDITDNIKMKKNKIKIRKNKDENLLNEIFLDCAINNIRRKVDLRNQFNQEITIEYIEKLLLNEIEKIKLILALYFINSENQIKSLSLNEGKKSNSFLIKSKQNKNLLDKSFNRLFRLNNYYNSLMNTNYKKRNNSNAFTRNKFFFNTIQKSRLNNGKYNTDKEYINILMSQMPNNLNIFDSNQDDYDYNYHFYYLIQYFLNLNYL